MKKHRALGVDLALRSVGLALASPGDRIEGLACIQVPQLEVMKTFDFVMQGYQSNRKLLKAATVVFVERPAVGLLTKLVHQNRTSVLSIEEQAVGRLIFLLALRRFHLKPEVYFLDPARVAQSVSNLVLTAEQKRELGYLKLAKRAKKDRSARPKLLRRAWLLVNAPMVNWADGAISEHESDAAHLACVGLQAYLAGQIEALGGTKQLA